MHRVLIAFLVSLLGVNFVQAEEAVPAENPNAWLRTEVMQAAYDINMTDDQRAAFAAQLREFIEGYQESVDRVLNRGDVSDPAGRIERQRNSLAKKMDRSIATILEEGQMPAYQKYRELLLAELGDDVDAYFERPNEEDIRIGRPGSH